MMDTIWVPWKGSLLRAVVFVTVMGVSAQTLADESVAPAAGVEMTNMFRGHNIDGTLEVGGLAYSNRDDYNRFAARLKIGYLFANDPIFLTVDAGVDVGGMFPLAAGIHVEMDHFVSGVFTQLSAGYASEKRPLFTAGLGWSMFGTELQWSPGSDHLWALFFKVKVPFGIIAYGKYQVDVDIERRSRSLHAR